MVAETITIKGANGDYVHAYFARPLGEGPFPAVVLIHHLPGWDEWYREAARRYAHHGYLTISPDLYCREGHGAADDVGARVRADGGVADDQVIADATGCMDYLRSADPEVLGDALSFNERLHVASPRSSAATSGGAPESWSQQLE